MPDSGNLFQRDEELTEKLFRKYARGGVWISGWRQRLNFYGKKALWVAVVEGSLALKRATDILGSTLGLILVAPILLATAMAIKVEDGGPIFFVQERVGKWGKIFRMYKFRSMIIDADKMKDQLMEMNEAGEVMFKMKRDPRITKVGRIIRKLSIDELPQLFNVFRGEMSLVGPRPALPGEVAKYSVTDRRRLEAIPGITGLWQVSGRSEIDFKGQVRLDTQYVESQSIWGDIVLLLKTIPAVLSGRGAY